MRDSKRLAEIRKLPCVRCGNFPPSQACHANWSEFGKSLGKKCDDRFTIPLCMACHVRLDQYIGLTREEAKAEFIKYLEKTNKMLDSKDFDDVF